MIILRLAGWLTAALTTAILTTQILSTIIIPARPQLTYVTQYAGDDWHIVLMDLRTTISIDLTRPLFHVPARSRLPAWSPDGRLLAFISDAGTAASYVYLYDIHTQSLTRLAEAPAYYTLPSWSPDGRLLAYGALATAQQGIHIYHLDDQTTHIITPLGLAASQSPRFSPDGQWISFVFLLDDNAKHVYIAKPDGTALAHVYGGSPDIQEPIWSPDGRYLTIEDRRGQQSSIVLVDPRTKHTQTLFRTTFTNADLAWSPDGKQIAFSILSREQSSITLVDDVQAAISDQRTTHSISMRYTKPYNYHSNPVYLPDGSGMVFKIQNTGMTNPELYLANRDGVPLRRLTYDTRQDWFTTWRIIR